MSNSELTDDYLSNRLNDAEKKSFEEQASSDPTFKSDLELQKQIIEGIRTARALELKAMLANVPVGGGWTSAVFGKIAAAIVGAGVIGGAIYYFNQPSTDVKTEVTIPLEIVQEKKIVPEVATTAPAPTSTQLPEVKKDIPLKKEEQKKVVVTPHTQPKINVVDPSDDMDENKDRRNVDTNSRITRPVATRSHIQVDIDATSKQYTFHYQFLKDKLILYGTFDNSLYEILEINGDEKSVFLFYKNNYYLLSDKQHTITRLEPIRDAALLKKLRDYRG